VTFKPGESGNPEGRPVGCENKITRKAKWLLNALYDELKREGVDKLVGDASANDKIKAILAGIPKEIKAEVDTKITHTQPIKIEFED
jgi:hypothetical protein